MSTRAVPVVIHKLPSGVPGLDEVLGGGIPEFSFNLIAGGPGCGKTTLAHQILFANATPSRKGIYFSLLGEPPIKMLRYQQQYSFFDAAKLDESIRFVHLGEEALGGPAKVFERIVSEVEESSPALVVVDSFRAVVDRTLDEPQGHFRLRSLMQELALHLTSCEATTFLVGEFESADATNHAVMTVADGILWLTQDLDRNSVVRKIQAVKVRGQGQIPGLHTVRITDDGMRVFPRLLKPEERRAPVSPEARGLRLPTGIPELDKMLGGGIPAGYSTLVAGPSGSGKTVLSNQFIVEGVRRGEKGVVAVFEKRPDEYLHTTPRGQEFEQMVKDGQLEILYLRPLDLSIDETLLALRDAVMRTGAERAVIDSLSGLELALAPTFRADFRESLYRMMGALAALGVTVMATVELADSFVDLRFSPQGIAFLTDAIIMQRYFEVGGQLRRLMSVVKVRASDHSKDLCEYEIGPDGLTVLGTSLEAYQGILSGSPLLPGSGQAGGGGPGGQPR